MNTFEDELLVELRTLVADRAKQHRPPVRKRRVMISLATCLTVAAGMAVALPLLGGKQITSPAYSVTVGSTGKVSVKIIRFEDAEGLERDLAAAGVSADVHYLPAGKTCRRTPAGVEVTADEHVRPDKAKFRLIQLEKIAVFEEHDGYSVMTVDLAVVKGKTLTMETTSPRPLGPMSDSLNVHLLKDGTFGPCVVVDG
ncbi:hypothetical protein GCM10009789_43590 [Kribbella sancticallisti]|uniref:Uncharacterized protein n=1 Tax=Kribbella sancticallisti TaxID=460087 RepID=A0ABP4PPD9_9ACTN